MKYRIQIYADDTLMSQEYLKEFEDDRYDTEEEKAVKYAFDLSKSDKCNYCVALWRKNPNNLSQCKLVAKFYH